MSGVLLTLSVSAMLAGLASAVYLEQSRQAPLAPTPPAAADSRGIAAAATEAQAVAVNDLHDAAATPAAESHESHTSDPLAAAAAVPSWTAAIEAPAEPHTGSTEPPTPPVPPQTALLEMAPARPAVVAPAAPAVAAHSYWVEYGVFVGERYARQLQKALSGQGLDATLVPTRRPDGRPLIRVRSGPLLDYTEARAVAQSARDALKISTLVHRVAAPAPVVATAAHDLTRAPSRGYWVQFGAFPRRYQAARLQGELAQGGIAATISMARGKSGKPLFYVRSIGFADRQSAVAVARRGQEAAKVAFLVGRSTVRSASRAGELVPSPPPRATGSAG